MLLKFKRNTVYMGESYGPSYPETVAEVERPWVATFLAQSRAEPLTDDELAAYKARKAGKKAGSSSTPPPAGKCAGTTKKGNPCRSKAVEGSEFCAAHQDQEDEGDEDDDESDED